MAKPIECKCDHMTTCGHCLRNAKPWHWTPSKASFSPDNRDWLGAEKKEKK